MHSSLSMSRSQKKSQSTDQFKRLLNEVGIHLTDDDNPHILTQPQSLVVRDLQNALIAKDSKLKSQDFIKNLKLLCSNESFLQKSLSKTVLKEDSRWSPAQDALLRLFMCVECLQEDVMEFLLQYLWDLCGKDPEDTEEIRLVLDIFQFLPNLQNPKAVATKLLDIIDTSAFHIQHTVLIFINQILPISVHNEAGKELGRILTEADTKLAGVIIDCLNNLHLSDDAQRSVNDYIINRLLPTRKCYDILPILIEFLIMKSIPDEMFAVLMKIREILDNVMRAESSDLASIKLLIFDKFEVLLRLNKNLFDEMINMVVHILVPEAHKPIDLLFLFAANAKFSKLKRAKIVENTIKKKIKTRLFKIELFEQVCDKYFVQQLFANYFESNLRMSFILLTSSKEKDLIETGKFMFKALFEHKFASHKNKVDIIYELLPITGCYDSKNTAPALETLHSFQVEQLKPLAGLLMKMFEGIEGYEMKEVKQLFDIICKVCCKLDESHSGIKDDLHMLIRKQLSHHKRPAKLRGIIGAVVLSGYTASVDGEQAEVENSITEISDLPEGPPRNAAGLLELTRWCIRDYPDLLGIYYDQLSSMVVTVQNLDRHFMSWLCENMTNNFQKDFIVESVPEMVEDLKVSTQYSLNSAEEIDVPITVNIAGLTLQTNESSVLILAPQFRLLRLIHFREENGDLSSIDALLGSGLILPEIDDIESLGIQDLKHNADCLYHSINWIRELISAFVTQTNKKIRNKVLARVMNLIELEQQLDGCMGLIPTHKLPFDALNNTAKISSPKKTKRPPAKKLKSNPVVHDTTIGSSSNASLQNKPAAVKKSVLEIERSYVFREIDTDVIKLLKYPLEGNATQSQNNPTTLHLNQFQFILGDFVAKLDTLLKRKYLGLTHLTTVEPSCLISDCPKIIPNIDKHMQVIAERIKLTLDSSDGCYDVPAMFSEEMIDLKIAFSLILQFYALLFSWSGFHHVRNQQLLLECLKCIVQISGPTQRIATTDKLIPMAVNYFHNYIDQCIYLQSAAYLIETLQNLHLLCPVPELKKFITSASEKLLKKRWFNLDGKVESKRAAHANLDILIKAYLQDAKITTISGLVGTFHEQIETIKTSKDSLPMLKSLDTSSSYIFFRALCTALCDRIKPELASKTNQEHLNTWRITATALQGLMNITKIQQTRTNLSWFMKKSIAILRVFLSQGIPMMEIMLRSKPDDVSQIFSILHVSVRYLNAVCCHAKATKDMTLMTAVPHFKSILESLVCHVKVLFVSNNCASAFWVGTLKNRNLQGEDILSQHSVSSVADEELPPDEESEEDVAQEEHSSVSDYYD